MQWSFPSDDLVSFMLMQFVLRAVITTFAETNVGFPTTRGTSSALMGNHSLRHFSGDSTVIL
jgi:hypothetical protein